MEARVPFTSFTSSRLFVAISLILVRKIAQEWSLGGQLGKNGICVKRNTFLTRWKFPAKFREFFGKWKRPFCHFEMSPFIEV